MESNIKDTSLSCTLKIEKKYNMGAVTEIRCRCIGDKSGGRCISGIVPEFVKKKIYFILNRVVSLRQKGKVSFCICQYGLKKQKSIFIILDAKFIIVLKVC